MPGFPVSILYLTSMQTSIVRAEESSRFNISLIGLELPALLEILAAIEGDEELSEEARRLRDQINQDARWANWLINQQPACPRRTRKTKKGGAS